MVKDQIPHVGELLNSLKLGMHLPGKHIPIVDDHRIIEERRDYLILLAWPFTEAITTRIRAEGVKSRLVVPLPEFAVLRD